MSETPHCTLGHDPQVRGSTHAVSILVVPATVLGEHWAFDGKADVCGPCFNGMHGSWERLSALGFARHKAFL